MEKPFAIVMYGQGGWFVDLMLSGNGTGKLAKRIEATGIEVLLLKYWEIEKGVAALLKRPKDAPLIIGGTSLGASNAVLLGQHMKIHGNRRVEYMFGIQPSLYGGAYGYTNNVIRALCVYNPTTVMTGGLGARKLIANPGNEITKIDYLESAALHPGDNIESIQQRILADIKRTVKPNG